MLMQRVRPIVVGNDTPGQHCLKCGARSASVCQVMAEPDLSRLGEAAVRMEIPRGQTFIAEGEPAVDFFNVTSGTAKLYKLLPDGRQQITGFATIGHFLGLAVSRNYAFSAEAIEPLLVCRFSRPKLRTVLEDFPALEHKLLETACNELATAQEQMLLLGRKTARERVASFLFARLQQANPCHETTRIHLPMTRGEVADYLGLTIETVSRTFSKFKAERKIATPSNDIVDVLDIDWLEGVATGAE
jgi:CRP/FNR family transcriptional regulator